ncbi:MAG: polysaccharide biosynthesis/export family protein [Bryobacteraceae bacterium]|nr:polysaccharide biosynthesis/export family protein [Bryobacteraceae bacterium]
MTNRHLRVAAAIVVLVTSLVAQQTASTYLLGPGDQITVNAMNVEELPKEPIRIGTDGYIGLPLIGRVKAAGVTVSALEAELAKKLSAYVLQPSVSVNLVEMRSQPVSVLGAVNKPGVYQVAGRKTLFEMLSMAEGLRADAGHSIMVTRSLEWGKLPINDARVDEEKGVAVGRVLVRGVMEARNPEDNVLIMPSDVITVPRAELVYVIGEVRKPGGFVLNEHESMSVLQALSLAEGITRTASTDKVRILRSRGQSVAAREEITVDVKRIIAGKAKDVPLLAEDILFVPNSAAKSALYKGLESGINIGTGVAIFRR